MYFISPKMHVLMAIPFLCLVCATGFHSSSSLAVKSSKLEFGLSRNLVPQLSKLAFVKGRSPCFRLRRSPSFQTACKALKVIIAGAPASGKGTQCEKIAEKFGLVHLSSGDILRAAVRKGTELGRKAQVFMDSGQLVPDELVIDVVRERLNEEDCIKSGWLLDGFPSTKFQAEALSNAGMVPDCFFLLDVPQDVLEERVLGRCTDPLTGKIYHMKFNPPPLLPAVRERLVKNSYDTKEKLAIRYREFKLQEETIERYYKSLDCIAVIDGARNQSEVTSDVLDSISASKKIEAARYPFSFAQDTLVGQEAKIGGLLSLIAIDKLGAQIFESMNIAFPSSLGVMVLLFASMLALDKQAPKFAKKLNDFFAPSVAIFKAWMPLFFVPPLVVLPLKYGLIADKLVQLSILVVVGMIASTASAGLVGEMFPQEVVMRMAGSSCVGQGGTEADVLAAAKDLAPTPALPKPTIPLVVAAIAIVAGFVTSQADFFGLFCLSASVGSYLLASKAPAAFKMVVHPVLGSAICTSALVALFALVASPHSYSSLLAMYYGTGSGAGDLISSLLGPVIVSFGLQLYVYRNILLRNAVKTVGTTFFSAVFGLASSAIMAQALMLTPLEASLAPLTRCITTPLALAGAGLVGADTSLAAFLVAPTGILGASFGERLLKKIRIKDEFTGGLAIGAASHGIGAASVASKPLKFAAAVVSMTLTGLWTIALLAVPDVRALLLRACSV